MSPIAAAGSSRGALLVPAAGFSGSASASFGAASSFASVDSDGAAAAGTPVAAFTEATQPPAPAGSAGAGAAAGAASGSPEGPPSSAPPGVDVDLTGLWEKDAERSQVKVCVYYALTLHHQ